MQLPHVSRRHSLLSIEDGRVRRWRVGTARRCVAAVCVYGVASVWGWPSRLTVARPRCVRCVQVWLTNLSDVNVTKLNNKNISGATYLANGDVFNIAGRVFRFEYCTSRWRRARAQPVRTLARADH